MMSIWNLIGKVCCTAVNLLGFVVSVWHHYNIVSPCLVFKYFVSLNQVNKDFLFDGNYDMN